MKAINESKLPFFSIYGFGNNSRFGQRVVVHNAKGYHSAVLTGFARTESLANIWKKKDPEFCDIWAFRYNLLRSRFYVFGKVIRGLIVKDANRIESVYVITRNAKTIDEKRVHPRHPVLGTHRFRLV